MDRALITAVYFNTFYNLYPAQVNVVRNYGITNFYARPTNKQNDFNFYKQT